MDTYQGLHFLKPDGSYDLTTNTVRISRIMQEGGFVQDGKKQVYKDMHIFPVEYFCPRQTTGELLITDNTYCNHHFMGSWNNKEKGISLKRIIGKIVGKQNMVYLIKLKRRLFG